MKDNECPKKKEQNITENKKSEILPSEVLLLLDTELSCNQVSCQSMRACT